jgi:hypothetical protein
VGSVNMAAAFGEMRFSVAMVSSVSFEGTRIEMGS